MYISDPLKIWGRRMSEPFYVEYPKAELKFCNSKANSDTPDDRREQTRQSIKRNESLKTVSFADDEADL